MRLRHRPEAPSGPDRSRKPQRGERNSRIHDRWLLLQALRGQGLLPDDVDPDNIDSQPMSAQLIAALHAYLARSPASILLVQLMDLMREVDQVNLPEPRSSAPTGVHRAAGSAGLPGVAPVLAARSTTG